MTKKTRKLRKKDRTKSRAMATPAQSRPTVEAAPHTPETVEVRPEDIVGEIVAQVFHALDEILPEPAHAVAAPHDNRRKHPRIALSVEIDLASESHFFSGLSGDVSEGGVFVETYRNIPVGSEVALDFALPNGTIHAHGEVKWHRNKSDTSPPGLGVEFEGLSDEQQKVISTFCARRAPLFYEVAS